MLGRSQFFVVAEKRPTEALFAAYKNGLWQQSLEQKREIAPKKNAGKTPKKKRPIKLKAADYQKYTSSINSQGRDCRAVCLQIWRQ